MALWDEAFEAAATRQAQRFLDRIDDAVLAGSDAIRGDDAAAATGGGGTGGARAAATPECSRAEGHRTVQPDTLAAALGAALVSERGHSDSGSADSECSRHGADTVAGGSDGSSSEEESPAIMAELAEWGRGRVHVRVRGVPVTATAAAVPVPAINEPDEVFAQHGQLGAWLRNTYHKPGQQDQHAARRAGVMNSLFDTLWQDLQHPDVAHILPFLSASLAPEPEQEWHQEADSERQSGGAEMMRFSSSSSSRGSCSTSSRRDEGIDEIFDDAEEYASSQPASDDEFPRGHAQESASGYAGDAVAATEAIAVAGAPLPPLEPRHWRRPTSPGGTVINDGRTFSAPSLNIADGLTGAVLDPGFDFDGLSAGASSKSRNLARSARSAGGWGQRPDGSMRPLHRPLSGGATRGSEQRGIQGSFKDKDRAVVDNAGTEDGDGPGGSENRSTGWSFLPPIVGRGVGGRR